MVLNTKRKDLGRSRLSSIFGSRLKLAKMEFFDKNSIMFVDTVSEKELFQNSLRSKRKHKIIENSIWKDTLWRKILKIRVGHVFTWLIWNMGEVLVLRREKWKKFIADIHVLGLFIPKKHDLSEKKNFRLSRAVAVVIRNLCHAYSLPLKR
jgi:hypothetical protein